MIGWFHPKIERKARKAHRCVWCGERISIGDLYAYQSGIVEFQYQTNRWHRECWDSATFEDFQDGFTLYGGERHKGIPKARLMYLKVVRPEVFLPQIKSTKAGVPE